MPMHVALLIQVACLLFELQRLGLQGLPMQTASWLCQNFLPLRRLYCAGCPIVLHAHQGLAWSHWLEPERQQVPLCQDTLFLVAGAQTKQLLADGYCTTSLASESSGNPVCTGLMNVNSLCRHSYVHSFRFSEILLARYVPLAYITAFCGGRKASRYQRLADIGIGAPQHVHRYR